MKTLNDSQDDIPLIYEDLALPYDKLFMTQPELDLLNRRTINTFLVKNKPLRDEN
jgi:hypothetical protein